MFGYWCSARTMAYPIRWVNEILPPRVRLRWLLITIRLSNSSLAGTARTLVAVGTVSDCSMFLAMAAAACIRDRAGRTGAAVAACCGAGLPVDGRVLAGALCADALCADALWAGALGALPLVAGLGAVVPGEAGAALAGALAAGVADAADAGGVASCAVPVVVPRAAVVVLASADFAAAPPLPATRCVGL